MKQSLEKRHFEQSVLPTKEVIEKEAALSSLTRELLYLVCILKQGKHSLDLAKLSELLIRKIEAVVLLTAEGNFYAEEVDKVRFMLCTALDEALANYVEKKGLTSYTSLTTYYYKEQLGGEHFFDLVEAASKDVRNNLPLLSLGHRLLCIGFKGQYALKESGAVSLSDIRSRIFFLIKKAISQKKTEEEFKETYSDSQIIRQVKKFFLPLMTLILLCSYAVFHQQLNRQKKRLHEEIKAQLKLQ